MRASTKTQYDPNPRADLSSNLLGGRPANPVSNFFPMVAPEAHISDSPVLFQTMPTKVAMRLPALSAAVFEITDARIIKDCQILAAAIDTHCRAVDNVADIPQERETASANLQFSTLTLLQAIEQVYRRYQFDIVGTLRSCMARASVAERRLYKIRERNDWQSSGRVDLLGEKNASLLLIPLLMNSLCEQPWSAADCESAFLAIFLNVQQIDDVIDLNEDIASNRYTHFRSLLDANCLSGGELALIDLSITYIEGVFEQLLNLLLLLSCRRGILEDHVATLKSAIARISHLRTYKDYVIFRKALISLVPPVFSYAA